MIETDLLKALREQPEFRSVMDDLLKYRPVIPEFRICKTKDEQEMVVENIKYETARRQGFDLLLTYLTGRKP